jgi:hypothetical protein
LSFSFFVKVISIIGNQKTSLLDCESKATAPT